MRHVTHNITYLIILQVLAGLVGTTVQDKEMEKVIMRAICEAGSLLILIEKIHFTYSYIRQIISLRSE